MTFAAGTHVKAQSTNTNSITSASIDTTGNDLLVWGLDDYSGATASTVSDSKSNTWTQIINRTNDSTDRTRMFYAKNATVGTGHTFTATVTGGFPAFAVMAFSGSDPAAPFDNEDGNGTDVGNNGLVLAGLTPHQNDSLIVAFLACATAGTPDSPAIDSGFTLVESAVNVNGVALGMAFAYKIQVGAPANVTPTFSWTSTCTHMSATQSAFAPALNADPTVTHPPFQGHAVHRM